MKQFIILILTFISAKSVYGQEILIDSCGRDSSNVLNKWEISYFKGTKTFPDSLSVEGKRFAFVSGNNGHRILNKKLYFELWGRKYFTENNPVANSLIILTPQEKLNSGGYDFIIVSWSKTLITAEKRKILLQRLKIYSGNAAH